MGLLGGRSDVDWVYTWWEEVDERGFVLRSPVRAPELTDGLRELLRANMFVPSATVYGRSCFSCCGVFDEHLTPLWPIRLPAGEP
jgi:hypothetical protein